MLVDIEKFPRFFFINEKKVRGISILMGRKVPPFPCAKGQPPNSKEDYRSLKLKATKKYSSRRVQYERQVWFYLPFAIKVSFRQIYSNACTKLSRLSLYNTSFLYSIYTAMHK